MKVSMVDGLGGVNARQRALRAKRLANLARHCERRGDTAVQWRFGVQRVEWGQWAMGPQRLQGAWYTLG